MSAIGIEITTEIVIATMTVTMTVSNRGGW